LTAADKLRSPAQLHFEDVRPGQSMPSLVIGPISPMHIFRWSAAMENWHRIHYDQNFAIYHEGLPNVLLQGSWKQSILPRYLKDLCLPNGWAWKVSFQHRAMIVPGDTITVWSTVTKTYEVDGLGFVALDVGMRLQYGAESCPGTATIVLPLREGPPVPYPFVPPASVTASDGGPAN
jgi:acyl dehydratase